MAIQPDQYVALPSLYGAPAYSRPPRPALAIERPLDPDDLPLERHQTDEERRLADALLGSRGAAPVGFRSEFGMPGGGNPGYLASGSGDLAPGSQLQPRRLTLRTLTGRIRSRG